MGNDRWNTVFMRRGPNYQAIAEPLENAWNPQNNNQGLQVTQNSPIQAEPQNLAEQPRQQTGNDRVAKGQYLPIAQRPALSSISPARATQQQNQVELFQPERSSPAKRQTRPVEQKASSRLGRNITRSNNQPVAPAKDTSPSSAGATVSSLRSDISLPSVNLGAHRAPRPNNDFEGSTDPSLPSSNGDAAEKVLTLEENEIQTALPLMLPAAVLPTQRPDVRNEIGIKVCANNNGNTWHKFSWTVDKGTMDDDTLNGKQYADVFIRSWRDGCSTYPNVVFIGEDGSEHWKCDINTETGRFLPPIWHPESYPVSISPHVNGGTAQEWRHLVWNSTLLMCRKVGLKSNGNRVSTKRLRRGQGWLDFPPDLDDPEIIKAQREQVEKFNAQLPGYSVCSPRMPCYLRPAELSDMEEVRAIYNWEVQNGLQAPDSDPLSLEDFIKIYEETQNIGFPFLVAICGLAKQLKIKTGNVDLTRCTPHPNARVPPIPKLAGKVLGFAYLSVWSRGLAGSTMGSGRASAKVNLYVHQEYRRKRIGFSLLDKLFSTTSTRYSTASSYDFVDVSNNPVYRSPEEHERKCWRLFLNFNVLYKCWAGDNPRLAKEQEGYEAEYKGLEKIFNDVFNFELQARFKMAYRTPKSRPGPVLWLDALIHQHDCHNGHDFREVTNN